MSCSGEGQDVWAVKVKEKVKVEMVVEAMSTHPHITVCPASLRPAQSLCFGPFLQHRQQTVAPLEYIMHGEGGVTHACGSREV